MKTDLRSLVYVSSAVREMSEFELEALLMDCRKLNQRMQVTGTLLYSGGGFMQCIEGPSEAIRITFDRIKKSTRHSGIIEIVDEPADSRAFPDFQMGFQRADRAEVLKASTEIWSRRLATCSNPLQDYYGVSVLETFWKQAARTG